MTDHNLRDRVIRDYINGRIWDTNREFALVRKLVGEGHPKLADFPLIHDYEWEVECGRTDLGRGDLVYTDGKGNFAVVEVKFIDISRSGSTARVKRTKSRTQVRNQAFVYADAFLKMPGKDVITVRAFAYTDDIIHPGLIEVSSPR